MTASEFRSFASIVCRKCCYLEFPGCDLHGLYTESWREEEQLHCKCPQCNAATNNVLPFRNGCRRCKEKCRVSMWCCTIAEMEKALHSFPRETEEIAHTCLVCDACGSLSFPTAKKTLTLRTPHSCFTDAITQKSFSMAAFQRSMAHVQGCPRTGMPLQKIAVQLPKSEVSFALERLQYCPTVDAITTEQQYKARKLALSIEDNQLHQVYLKLLTTILSNFDINSSRSEKSLYQISELFSKFIPLSIFKDWSPPPQLPATYIVAPHAFGSSYYGEHSPQRVLENSCSYWRSICTSDDNPEVDETFVGIYFDQPIVIPSVYIRWHPKLFASKFSVSISNDGIDFEYIDTIEENKHIVEHRVVVPGTMKISHVKICILDAISPDGTCGVELIRVCHLSHNALYKSPEVSLFEIQTWLGNGILSTNAIVQSLSLKSLQFLSLASGSLSSMLELVYSLLKSVLTANQDVEMNDDELSNVRLFLRQLSDCLEQEVMNCEQNSFKKEENTESNEPCNKQKITASIRNEVRWRTIQLLRNIPGTTISGPPVPPQLETQSSCSTFSNNKGEAVNTRPMLVMSFCQPAVLDSIKTRSQFAMVILGYLSDLSIWQMQRMQKCENEDENAFPLEEPFSIHLCAQMFELCYRILQLLLPQNLKATEINFNSTRREEFDCVEILNQSSKIFSANIRKANIDNRIDFNVSFTPESMSLSILQILTSNIRRLVVSKVNPAEFGLEPPIFSNDNSELLVSPALNPLVDTLESLISSGCKRSDPVFPLSLQAAAIMEVGMEAIYPSAAQRTKLLTTRMGFGATLEIQLCWPAEDGNLDDPRFERLILLLQLECIKKNMRHALRGRWNFFIHLLIKIPDEKDTANVLSQSIAKCIQDAGFTSWKISAGIQEISITLQRHLYWNRIEKMTHDSGMGWIRVYPKEVASYEHVLSEVDKFIKPFYDSKHE